MGRQIPIHRIVNPNNKNLHWKVAACKKFWLSNLFACHGAEGWIYFFLLKYFNSNKDLSESKFLKVFEAVSKGYIFYLKMGLFEGHELKTKNGPFWRTWKKVNIGILIKNCTD